MIYRVFIVALALAPAMAAQNVAFPSRAYFREQWTKPPLDVEMRPPLRLEDYVVSGKMELSLRSYIELVMANNTDVAVQRLTLVTAQNAIQRAFAQFDPAFQASFNATRSNTPSNSVLEGASILSNLSQRANFSYTQT
ncbi:MAG: hypothetical protein HY238_12135, partial [Acidobacteria bacterium]|nr:hypothetical protein [Acidobacteriota bacterium]